MILEYDHNGKGRAGHGASRGCHSLRGRDEVKILMDCLFRTRTGIQNGKKPHAHGVNVGRYFFRSIIERVRVIATPRVQRGLFEHLNIAIVSSGSG